VPDLLRALAAFKPIDLAAVARAQLKADDVIVRATAADILSDLPPEPDNTRALVEALPRALSDEINDAALSVLGALSKQQGADVNRAVETALETTDYLVRRRAADILRERAGGTDSARRVETVNTRNHRADYERAAARTGKSVRASSRPTRALSPSSFCRRTRRSPLTTSSARAQRLLQRRPVPPRRPELRHTGRRPARRRQRRPRLPDSRRDEHSPLRPRRGRHGALGQATRAARSGSSRTRRSRTSTAATRSSAASSRGMDVVDRITRGDRIRTVTITETRAGQRQ
jgi:hypothetical protein